MDNNLHRVLEVKGTEIKGQMYVNWEDYDRLVCDMASCKAIVECFVLAGIQMGGHLPDTDEANEAYQNFENVAQRYKAMFQSNFGRKL
jgi:hypothetical protein